MLRFLRLPAGERRLLLEAALMLAVTAAGIRVVRFQAVRRWLARLAAVSDREVRAADRIVWAVETASGRLPGARTCLPRALVAQALLARHGFPANFRIGVARRDDGRVAAHAWVECGGEVVIGGGDIARYCSLLEIMPEDFARIPGSRVAR